MFVACSNRFWWLLGSRVLPGWANFRQARIALICVCYHDAMSYIAQAERPLGTTASVLSSIKLYLTILFSSSNIPIPICRCRRSPPRSLWQARFSGFPLLERVSRTSRLWKLAGNKVLSNIRLLNKVLSRREGNCTACRPSFCASRVSEHLGICGDDYSAYSFLVERAPGRGTGIAGPGA